MTVTDALLYTALVLVAAAGHGPILRFAVRLMVEVPMALRDAYRIVALEYAAAGVVAGAAALAGANTQQVPATLAFVALLTTGAVLIGRRVSLAGGEPVGFGNAVLIQFMQVPMVIPFAILLSFFIVPPF